MEKLIFEKGYQIVIIKYYFSGTELLICMGTLSANEISWNCINLGAQSNLFCEVIIFETEIRLSGFLFT